MKLTDVLRDMTNSLFGDKVLSQVMAVHMEKMKYAGDSCKISEWERARTHLEEILPAKSIKLMERGDKLCIDNCRYMMEFAFVKGVYAGCIEGKRYTSIEDSFHAHVVTIIFDSYDMLYRDGYIGRLEELDAVSEKIEQYAATVSSEAAEDICCLREAWMELPNGVARQAFALGWMLADTTIYKQTGT